MYLRQEGKKQAHSPCRAQDALGRSQAKSSVDGADIKSPGTSHIHTARKLSNQPLTPTENRFIFQSKQGTEQHKAEFMGIQ
jgi:hypothetical protein